MMIYLAAKKPLTLVSADKKNPELYILELNPAYSNGVERQFKNPFIYEVIAYGGCGCGFSYGQYEEQDEQREIASVRCLSEYLAKAVKETGMLELYACWDSDQHFPPKQRIVMRPAEIGGEAFQFEERTYALIVSDSPVSR